jgi:adenylate cyclase
LQRTESRVLQRRFSNANKDEPEARSIVLRIGVNLGDVIVEGSDLYGDGVNVAARLQTMAEPGGVRVSRSVYEQVKGKLDCAFDELGPQPAKRTALQTSVPRMNVV